MSESFNIENPDGARKLLNRIRSFDRVHGIKLFNTGAVANLDEIQEGEFSARVADGETNFETSLYSEPAGRWDAECECDKGYECAHICAALMALLAEYRTAAVRNLSSSLATALGQPKEVQPPISVPFKEQLASALGRPLSNDEKRFLNRLHQLFVMTAQRGGIGSWELQELGLSVRHQPWGFLNLWPSTPKTEHEFWLYIVSAVREGGGEVPQFMLPVSDTAVIETRLRKWRRGQEVQKWENALANLSEARPIPVAQGTEVDLRLVVGENDVRLEVTSPETREFQPLKTNRMRKLLADRESGNGSFTLEGELLWDVFTAQGMYSPSPKLPYENPETRRILNHLLRIRALESRICNARGQPLQRTEQPLKWKLEEAVDREDDYKLSLVQADGSAVPELLAVLPGHPTLYLTCTGVFTGPEPGLQVLQPDTVNCIPAPALEKPAGIALLEALEIALPQRIQQRIRKIPYEVAITCELKQSWFGAEREDCHFEVLAEASDGHREAWVGTGWMETAGKKKRKATENDGTITVYDRALLARVPALLEPLNLKSSGWGESALVMKLSKNFADVFSAWVKSLPGEIRLELKGELASFLDAEVAGRVKLDVTEVEIDWFDLHVVLDIGDTTLTKEEIKLLLNAKGRFVRLKGRGWKRLQYDLSEDENEKLARLGLSARELSAEPQRLHALQLADPAAKKFLPEEQVEQLRRRADELKARVAPDLPGQVTAQLRPYQLEGFHFLAYLGSNRFGGILADDMGLGKTLQTLSWLVWLREQPKPQSGNGEGALAKPLPALVVCPKSVMDNWRAEAERFTPGLRVRAWHASEVPRLPQELTSADVHVLNYSQLRNVSEELRAVRWLAVILDEGQYIKNPNSQTAQVARTLHSEHRLILSGTPIENRLMDLWSLMAFAMPGVLGSRAQFGRLYDAKGDPFARKRLAARVRPFVLRRTKTQVAKDLPDRIEEDLFCELEGEQLKLYRAELKRAQQLLLSIKTQKELAQQQFNFLTSLLRLRQICCDPRLVGSESKEAGAKTEALLEQLEPLMEEGQKVLVFSQFVEMLNLLLPPLKERNWPVFYLSGQTENRGELVQNFQNSQGPGVFLISLKAGGFGLNLTAASYVVLFDPWWNPAVENQAIDRTHRIGQTNNVIAYRLLIKNSVEEKIRELQKTKKALAEDVLGEEKFAQSLTMDDLRFLFSD